MPPLDGAVPFAEMEDGSVAVGEDLHLDVARVGDELLDVDRRIGEVGLALALRGAKAPLRLSADSTTLRPFPPPPAEALIATGQPNSSPSRATSAAEVTGSVVPGTIGTPALRMSSRAATFDPITSIASGGGPIQTRPASEQARANEAFSARKP